LEPRITAAADQFNTQGKIINIQAYGKGNVHDTFLVTLDGMEENKFILQRMNTRIFHQPELVMQNLRIFSEHVHNNLLHFPLNSDRRWEVPRVLMAQNGQDFWVDPEGTFWRALSFIDRSQSFDTIQNPAHAWEVGYALGMFHALTRDLPIEKLADTLKGFHITPGYLRHFDIVLSRRQPPRSPEVDYGLEFINHRRTGVDILEKAKEQGKLFLRPIHGDPKVSNVMIEITTHQAISLVDLDTVKPGLIHYDIGDCLRSCCNPFEEDTEQWEAVRFEPALCRAILRGYLSKAGNYLEENDYKYLFEAIRLITFELGLRFLTDYLEGNIYFKVGHEKQNLTRALVQFKLTESIESQESAIRFLIEELR
jgi:Ser/Thr protein kinase RdoA (MazF antagonist)